MNVSGMFSYLCFLSLVKFVFLYFSFLSTIVWLNKDLYFLAAGKLSPTTTSAIDTLSRSQLNSTQLNSTQLTTPKEKSGLQEERSYKSLYKSPILIVLSPYGTVYLIM